MTNYKIVYQLSNRVKRITIPAHSPMEAFKKFKEMMPQIVYNNLSVRGVEVDIPVNEYVKKREPDLCIPCAPTFNKIIKHFSNKPVDNIREELKRPPAEYSNKRNYELI